MNKSKMKTILEEFDNNLSGDVFCIRSKIEDGKLQLSFNNLVPNLFKIVRTFSDTVDKLNKLKDDDIELLIKNVKSEVDKLSVDLTKPENTDDMLTSNLENYNSKRIEFDLIKNNADVIQKSKNFQKMIGEIYNRIGTMNKTAIFSESKYDIPEEVSWIDYLIGVPLTLFGKIVGTNDISSSTAI